MLPNEREIEEYWEVGYWVAPPLFDADEIDKAREAVLAVHSGREPEGGYPFMPPLNADKPRAVKTLMYAWYFNDVIRKMVTDPRITAIAASLMGVDRVRLWQDQVIVKPGLADGEPDPENNVGFHQDYSYWQDSSTTNMITANIVLQDTTEANGAMRVLMGSHRFGLLEAASHFFDPDLDRVRADYATERGSGAGERALEVLGGQVTFHHSLLVHGSGPNRSPEPRLTLAPAYFPDGARIRLDDHPESPHRVLMHAPVPGSEITGKYFPLVYDGSRAGQSD